MPILLTPSGLLVALSVLPSDNLWWRLLGIKVYKNPSVVLEIKHADREKMPSPYAFALCIDNECKEYIKIIKSYFRVDDCCRLEWKGKQSCFGISDTPTFVHLSCSVNSSFPSHSHPRDHFSFCYSTNCGMIAWQPYLRHLRCFIWFVLSLPSYRVYSAQTKNDVESNYTDQSYWEKVMYC
jgi:hypothetical protein